MRLSFQRFIVVVPSVSTALLHNKTRPLDFILRESDQLSNRKTSIKIDFLWPPVATTLLLGETIHLDFLLRENDQLSNHKTGINTRRWYVPSQNSL